MINTELPKTNGKCEPFPTTQRKSVHPLTMIVSMCVCVIMEKCLYKAKKGLIKHIQHLPMFVCLFFSEKIHIYVCRRTQEKS